MFLKFLFLLISLGTSTISLLKLNKLPNEEYQIKWNSKRLNLYSILNIIPDFVMFWLIAALAPPGEYGTGLEVLAFISVGILYLIPCCIVGYRLNKRMKKIYNEPYPWTLILGPVLFKAMFALMETIWLVEVK